MTTRTGKAAAPGPKPKNPKPQDPRPPSRGAEAPDELSGLKTEFPTRWVQRVPDGHPYVAVFRGTYLIFAQTQEEMRAKLRLR